MLRRLPFAVLFLMTACSGFAQEPQTFQDPLLDRMVGAWILNGTIAGDTTTHDVDVGWVLGHQYIQLDETSREKNQKQEPLYEATVFIGWDDPSGRYACLWLDNTGGGGLKGQAIAYAPRGGDSLAFLFKGGDGSLFHTTFAYNRPTDSWQWFMDGEEGGRRVPFARVNLIRRK